MASVQPTASLFALFADTMITRTLLAASLLAAAPAAAQTSAASAASQQPEVPAVTVPSASEVIARFTPEQQEDLWLLDLSTGGRVVIQLRPDKAPAHVERIKTLTRKGFYDGLQFHRVIEGFMAQGGDPKRTGEGGSDLPDLKAEFNDLPHMRGTVSMARTSDPDSANSQFFIMFQPMLKLDRHYTVFGRVIAGMRYVDAIERGEPPTHPTSILQASIAADHKPEPAYPEQKAVEDPVAAEAARLLQSAGQPPRQQP